MERRQLRRWSRNGRGLEKAWFQGARQDLLVVAEGLVWWGRASCKLAEKQG